MVYLFYGEEDFLITERIKQLKLAMPDSSLLYNFLELDGKRVNFSEIKAAALAIPFLGSGRLIVVDEWLNANKEEIDEAEFVATLERVPSGTDLVFREQNLDKRKKIVKLLLAKAEVKEFAALPFNQILKWVIARAKEKNANMNPAAANRLVAMIGSNLRMLDQEIDKLIAFRDGEEIRLQDIEEVCFELYEEDIFALIDSMMVGPKDKALEILYRNIRSGKHPLFLLKMIVRQYRCLLFARDLIDQSKAQASDLAKRLKIHPYTAKKALAQARKYRLEDLLRIYEKLARMDMDIKNGRIDVQLALEMLAIN